MRPLVDLFLKLCLVLCAATTGVFMACGSAGQDYSLARGWAGTACSFIQALPEANSESFPSHKKLALTVSSASIIATITEPSVSAVPQVYEQELP